LRNPKLTYIQTSSRKLADLFEDLSFPDDGQVIVETHSEYLIRRLQYLVAKDESRRKQHKPTGSESHFLERGSAAERLRERVVIYYLGPDPEADDYVRRIEITESGQLSQLLGSGFLDEASDLMTNLYTYGSQN
jgi:hypothetical protein